MPPARVGVGRVVPGLASAGVAAALFYLAWDDGSYGLASRNSLAIGVWWALIVLIGFGLVSLEQIPRPAVVLGALLAGLALWSLTSLLWSESAERTIDEANRVALYLGIFALAGLLGSRRSLDWWLNGLALGGSVIAVVALTSRLFPGSLPDRELERFLPADATRLSFPVGYWNGLAILLALFAPLLLRLAVVGRTIWVRALAVAPLPAIGAAVYLASSRGGVAAALVGGLLFVVAAGRSWEASLALAVSALGSAAAVTVLLQRPELVDGPLGTRVAAEQGRSAALLIGFVCAATGAAYAIASRAAAGRAVPARVGRIALAGLAGCVVVAVMAMHPLQRLETFKRPPGELAALDRGDFVRQHLLSSSGSGRWQFWEAAVVQWQRSPLVGDGAGSYESWWAENGSIAHFVKDAHSLYLEALGELGAVGFALVAGVVAVGLGAGLARTARSRGKERADLAALTAVFGAYAVSAAIDWMWELTVVSVLGFVALALAASRATDPTGASPGEPGLPANAALRVGGVVVAAIVLAGQLIPLLAERELDRSRSASSGGDTVVALRAARAAADLEPWAATPYLQLALVSEQAGRLPAARRWSDEAIRRDPRDWRLWLVSARIETKLGRVAAAERKLRQAVALNPRSPLFTGLFDATASG